MKHDYDISKQYQEDLIEAYKRVAPHSWSQIEAYRRTVKQPAKRYYITPKQAAQVISPMFRGDFSHVNAMMPNKRRMYYSLFNKVVELSEKRDFAGKSVNYIIQFAVLEPAPEFFVSHRVIAQIRSFLRNGYYEESGKVKEVPYRARSYEKLKEKRLKARLRRQHPIMLLD